MRDVAFHDAYARFGGRHNEPRVLSCGLDWRSGLPLTSPSPRVPSARHLRLPTEREFTRDQDQLATVLRENPAEVLTRDAFLRKRVRTPTLLATEAFWAWPFEPSRFRFEPVTQNHRRDYERPFFFRETPSFGRSRVLPFRTSCISLA